jgi:hypothetical protein
MLGLRIRGTSPNGWGPQTLTRALTLIRTLTPTTSQTKVGPSFAKFKRGVHPSSTADPGLHPQLTCAHCIPTCSWALSCVDCVSGRPVNLCSRRDWQNGYDSTALALRSLFGAYRAHVAGTSGYMYRPHSAHTVHLTEYRDSSLSSKSHPFTSLQI